LAEGKTARQKFQPRIDTALLLAAWLQTPEGKRHNKTLLVRPGRNDYFGYDSRDLVYTHLQAVLSA
jgi:hypothetical protein